MKILDVLGKEAINVDLKAMDKKGILDELAAPIARRTGKSQEELVKILLERERLGSTGIGNGIGIPHGKIKDLDALQLGFGLSRKGVPFESIDGRPAHLFFLLVTPENSAGLHLKLLARLSRLLKDEEFKSRLVQSSTADDVVRIIRDNDDDF
jgi:PTS system nitrogen regulatory IIA component